MRIDPDLAPTRTSLCACVDEDGTVYVFVHDTSDDVDVRVSYDEGVTWERYTHGACFIANSGGLSTDHAQFDKVVPSQGQLHLALTERSGDFWGSDVDQCFALASFGGWSTLEGGDGELSLASLSDLHRRAQRIGFGQITSNEEQGFWCAAYLPDDDANNFSGLSGTAGVLQSTAPKMRVSSAATTKYFKLRTTTTIVDNQCGIARLSLNSGAAQDRRSASSTSVCRTARRGVRVRDHRERVVGDPGRDHRQEQRHERVPGQRAELAYGDAFHIAWNITGKSQVTVWARLATTTQWTEIGTMTMTDQGSSVANSRVRFGSDALGAESDWVLVAFGVGQWRQGIDPIANVDGGVGLLWGKGSPADTPGRSQCPTRPRALRTSGGSSPTGGPTQVAEQVSLPVAHTRPVSNVLPLSAPSPSALWEATDDGEVRLTWDLGSAQWLGGALAPGRAPGPTPASGCSSTAATARPGPSPARWTRRSAQASTHSRSALW